MSAANGVLTIDAERRGGEGGQPVGVPVRHAASQCSLARERRRGAISATYRNGLLEVTVPLTAPEPAGRQIPIAKG